MTIFIESLNFFLIVLLINRLIVTMRLYWYIFAPHIFFFKLFLEVKKVIRLWLSHFPLLWAREVRFERLLFPWSYLPIQAALIDMIFFKMLLCLIYIGPHLSVKLIRLWLFLFFLCFFMKMIIVKILLTLSLFGPWKILIAIFFKTILLSK